MTEHSTEQRTTAGPTGPTAAPTGGPVRAADRSAWVRFGGVMMVVVGLFEVVEGLLALAGPTYYVLTNGVVVTVALGTWAWVHLIVGALVALTGATLLSQDAPWARAAGMGIVGASILVHLVFLPAAPLWSILVIALGVTVLVALANASSADAARP